MRRDERGQATLLIVGFFLVVALTVAVAVDASAAYLRRQGLDNLADSAALAAADAAKADQVYAGDLDRPAPIDVDVARRAAAAYLHSVSADDSYAGLALEVRTDGQTVTVRLSAPVDLPLAPPDWKHDARVVGEASALVLVGD